MIPLASTPGRLFLYATREADDGGERTDGMTESKDSENGTYWIGPPQSTSTVSGFYTGTSSTIASGTTRYHLYADE